MALVEFEKWLDDKIDYFKKKGTVVFGGEGKEDSDSDSDDTYGEFEMAEEQVVHRRSPTGSYTEQDDFEEPEYEFDDSELKGGDYYKFVWNEGDDNDDDDEEEVFDRTSLSMPMSRTQEVASYYDEDPSIQNSYNAVKLAQAGATSLETWAYDEENQDPSEDLDDLRPEGDGQSFPGSFTELRDRDNKPPTDLDYAYAQVSDDNSLEDTSHQNYHRSQYTSTNISPGPRPTLPMDSTYLSMDEDNDDDDMLQDVKFDDDDDTTQVPPDNRPIMVEERTLRAIYADKRRLFKKVFLIAAFLMCVVVFGVTLYIILKFTRGR